MNVLWSVVESLCSRGDYRAGVPVWTPERAYEFCRSRNRTWSRIFEWKL